MSKGGRKDRSEDEDQIIQFIRNSFLFKLRK